MPYTVDDLIRQFRSDVYDRPDVDGEGNPRDTLWSHEDVMHYLRTALSQWAKDTLAVRYNVTLDVAPGKARYYAGREIIEIARAALVLGSYPAARPRPLAQFNLGDACYADDYGMVYLTTYDIENRQGVPRAITRDYDPTYLRLFPIPTEAGFLHLNLVVYPPLAECGMPLPSSSTAIRRTPPASRRTVIWVAPASRALSTSSRTAEAGRSTTSPAAIWLMSSSGRSRMGRRGAGARAVSEGCTVTRGF